MSERPFQVTDDATAEVTRLRAENAEYAALVGKLSRLLTETANALKGDPDELLWHDWSDLPAVARRLVEERVFLEDHPAWPRGD